MKSAEASLHVDSPAAEGASGGSSSTVTAGSSSSTTSTTGSSTETSKLPTPMASALDGIIDSVVVTNHIGKIVYYNPAAEHMFGYIRDEALGQNVNMLMPSPFKEQHNSWLRKYQISGVPKLIGVPRVLKGQRRDQTVFPLEISLGPIHHQQNTTTESDERFFIAIMRDRSVPIKMDESRSFQEDTKLRSLLEANGMGQYTDLFTEQEISMQQFLRLSKEDLRTLGVVKMGALLRLEELIKEGLQQEEQQQQQQKIAVPQQHLDLLHSPLQQQPNGQYFNSPGGGGAASGPGGEPNDTPHKSRFRTHANESPTAIGIARKSSTSILLETVFSDELWFGNLIGQGSFGVVYMGQCRGVNVAIKKLMVDCRQEAELLSKVRHRNIAQCVGACIEPPDFFLIMELAVCNLTQAIKSRDIPPARVVDWTMQIAQGMDYLHTGAPQPIIHRDLKPGNVLLFEDGSLKISDFGLSRVRGLNDGTEKMSTVGTFEYMAPEVIKSEPYSEKADVFSYGVLVWEILTKQTPYNGLPALAIAFGVGAGKLKLPIPLACPKAFADLMNACWLLEYGKRPTFRDIIRILEKEEYSEFVRESPMTFLKKQAAWENEIGTSIGKSHERLESEGFHTASSSSIKKDVLEEVHQALAKTSISAASPTEPPAA